MPPSHQPSSTLFLFLLFFFFVLLLLLPNPTSAVAKKEPPPPSSSSLLAPPQTEDELEGDEGTAAWLSSLSTEDVLSSSSSMSSDSFSSFHSALAMTEDEEEGEEEGEEEEEEEGREENQTQEDDSDDDTASLEALLSAPALEDKRAESPWVRRFCQSPGHEFFCVVPASFIAEEFNWLGLPYDLEGIDLLLGKTLPHVGSSGASAAAAPPSSVEDEALFMAARRMYGLIHARFIVTQKGLNAMKAKFEAAEFGRCPRLTCEAQAVLPMGTREMGAANQGQEEDKEEEGKNGDAAVDDNGGGGSGGVHVFCPSCRQVYRPENAYHRSLDGRFWGSSFAHLFMLAFPELCLPLDKGVERKENEEQAGGEAVSGGIREGDGTRMKKGSRKRKRGYVPRVFGFRVVEEEELALQVKAKEKQKDKLPAEEEGGTLSVTRPPPRTAITTSPTAAAPRRKVKASPLSALLTRATRTNKGRIAVWQISRIGKPSRDKHHHSARRLLPLLAVPPLSLLLLVLKKRSSDFFPAKEEEIIIPPPNITSWTFEWPGDLFSAPKQGKR